MVMYWKKVAMILALCEILGGCGQQLPISDADPSAPVSGETTPGAEGETTPPVEVEPDPTPTLEAQVTETAAAAGTLTRRTYALENGDTVELLSLEAQGPTTAGAAVYTTTIPSDSVMRLCKADGSGWQETTAAPGTYQTSLLMVDSGEEGVLYGLYPPGLGGKRERLPPQSWHRRGGVDDGGAGRLYSDADGTGIEYRQYGRVHAGPVARSAGGLGPEGRGRPLWATYTNLGDGRWCYDGYYWITYSNYIPTGPDVYFQMSAAYLCRSMLAMAPYNRLADDLAPCMMDVMAQRQNEYGYFATSAGQRMAPGGLRHRCGLL